MSTYFEVDNRKNKELGIVDKYRLISKRIEDDFILNGRTHKDVLDKITTDLFDELELDLKIERETTKFIANSFSFQTTNGKFINKLEFNSDGSIVRNGFIIANDKDLVTAFKSYLKSTLIKD